jgi:hypothetical protein
MGFEMAMNDVVWILGAGFSKPLGGPLLDGLFVPHSVLQMRDRFHTVDYPSPNQERTSRRAAVDAALWLYNYGIEFENGTVPGFLA